MIPLPSAGVAVSVREHNCDLQILCDWIEGCLLFGSHERLSKTDFVDVLCEEEKYESQDFAREFLDTCWLELAGRAAAAPFRVAGERLERDGEWREDPAHAYCLCVSLHAWYRRRDGDYRDQGRLFEELCAAAVPSLLPGWEPWLAGWCDDEPRRLPEVVQELAHRLGEERGEIDRWTNPNANERGLDLVAQRRFVDTRPGRPVLLAQCASGRNWKDKLRDPDVRLWTQLVQMKAQPMKWFFLPFALDRDQLRHATMTVGGVVVDRTRLLGAPTARKDWAGPLGDHLRAWVAPRLPEAEI